MIKLTYTGMCEDCEHADLVLDCLEYQSFDLKGNRKEWTVRCIHVDACDAMKDKMIEKLRKDGDIQ